MFFIFLLTFTLTLLVWTESLGPLPTNEDLKDISNPNASEIYSSDGKLLGRYYVQNRRIVPFDSISPFVIMALVATEDARFFEHQGIDIRAWGRVLVKSILLGQESGGGGSTLSQQLAKNLFPRKKYRYFTTAIAKIKELFIASRLEEVNSKEELLNLYLNTVPFSGNAFGIEVASKEFFGKPASKLKPEEAAMLVGMLKGNTLYNPRRNKSRAISRRNTVLEQMYRFKEKVNTATMQLYRKPFRYSEADMKRYKEKPLELSRVVEKESLFAIYFREFLRMDLEKRLAALPDRRPDGAPYSLYSDGLKIYTTIDSKLQEFAERAVAEQMKNLQSQFDAHWGKQKLWKDEDQFNALLRLTERWRNMTEEGYTEAEIMKAFKTPREMTVFSWKGEDGKQEETRNISPLDSFKYYLYLLNCGFTAMEPQSGKVLAWVGGIDQRFFQYDHVNSRRQVGSTIKPVVYATALANNLDPCDYYENKIITYTANEKEGTKLTEPWTPQNADGSVGGYYSMAGALSRSLNTISAQFINKIGVEPVKAMATLMGMNGDLPSEPSIALGACEASLMEMMSVYGTIANRGLKSNPVYLLKVERDNGEILIEHKPTPEVSQNRILTEDISDMVIHMMKRVVTEGTAERLRYQYGLSNTQVAGKTGTTQNNSDGWFVCFTPHIVVGAWVGGEFPITRFRSTKLGGGSNTALPIVGNFMHQLSGTIYVNPEENKFPDPPEYITEILNCPSFISCDNFLGQALNEFLGAPDAPVAPGEEPKKDGILKKIGKLFGNDQQSGQGAESEVTPDVIEDTAPDFQAYRDTTATGPRGRYNNLPDESKKQVRSRSCELLQSYLTRYREKRQPLIDSVLQLQPLMESPGIQ